MSISIDKCDFQRRLLAIPGCMEHTLSSKLEVVSGVYPTPHTVHTDQRVQADTANLTGY